MLPTFPPIPMSVLSGGKISLFSSLCLLLFCICFKLWNIWEELCVLAWHLDDAAGRKQVANHQSVKAEKCHNVLSEAVSSHSNFLYAICNFFKQEEVIS